MRAMRTHAIVVTERELRMILAWYDAWTKDGRRTPLYATPSQNFALYDRLRKL
jgi:hypothetical protein